jgi:hypothetical protein
METKLKELGYPSDKKIRRRILNVIIGYLEIHKSDRVEQFQLAKRNIENLTRGMTDKELKKVIQFIENIDLMRQIAGEEQENL